MAVLNFAFVFLIERNKMSYQRSGNQLHYRIDTMKPKMILVLSSWSSGSSAVTGFLSKCGVDFFPPFLTGVTDPRTPNTYESNRFRDILIQSVDEGTLQVKFSPKEFSDAFQAMVSEKLNMAGIATQSLGLKHPLSAFWLLEISEIVEPIFVVVTRSIDKIEATRVRRNWFEMFGSKGAVIIYNKIYTFLQENGQSFLAISYEDFLNSQDERMKLLDYCDIKVSEQTAQEIYFKIISRQ